MRALQDCRRVGDVALRPVALRVERIRDALVEEVGNARQPVRGIVGVGERGAIRQRDAEPIPGRVVTVAGRERAGRGRDCARQQSKPRIVGQVGRDAVRVDDGLRQTSRKMLRDRGSSGRGHWSSR